MRLSRSNLHSEIPADPMALLAGHALAVRRALSLDAPPSLDRGPRDSASGSDASTAHAITTTILNIPSSATALNAPPIATAPNSPPPTLIALLTGDLAPLVVENLDDIGDIAALITALQLPALREAAEARAAILLGAEPLRSGWSARFDFERDALWPDTIAAVNWHPKPAGIAALRAPAVCKVTGRGRCYHGLCQKRDAARAGVARLLETLSRAPTSQEPSASATTSSHRRVLALECTARLNGALGRADVALRDWQRAADAGSARALLDIGLRRHRASDGSAFELLQRAIAAAGYAGSGEVERLLVQAQARLYMGYMRLDGDGVAQVGGSPPPRLPCCRTLCL